MWQAARTLLYRSLQTLQCVFPGVFKSVSKHISLPVWFGFVLVFSQGKQFSHLNETLTSYFPNAEIHTHL